MLSQLVYVSLRKANCTDEEIEKILASSKKNNNALDITGVLLYSDTHFVQYLEGENKNITKLYDKIKQDPRHKNSVMLLNSPVKERSFPSWQMVAKKFNKDLVEFKGDVDPSEKEAFLSILSGKNQDTEKAVTVMKKFFN